eukprot:364430-Chlamydomonas_euryale.AAC.8
MLLSSALDPSMPSSSGNRPSRSISPLLLLSLAQRSPPQLPQLRAVSSAGRRGRSDGAAATEAREGWGNGRRDDGTAATSSEHQGFVPPQCLRTYSVRDALLQDYRVGSATACFDARVRRAAERRADRRPTAGSRAAGACRARQ